jgi:hypothetical protein
MAANLLRILDDKLWDKIITKYQRTGGAYLLIAKQDGKREKIDRFLAKDQRGVLYIGKANAFVDRVIELKKSLSPSHQSNSHGCAKQYNSNMKISERFPLETLYIQLIASPEPKRKETELLSSYRDLFGEVPPLNSSTS